MYMCVYIYIYIVLSPSRQENKGKMHERARDRKMQRASGGPM